MNQLNVGRRAQIIHHLVEGNSIRATCRLTDSAKNTIVKLLCQVGTVCADYQDRTLRNLKCRRIQCDEIWSFIGCKQKQIGPQHQGKHWGDAWTWTALDADTKLVPCWHVGPRDANSAYHFIHDLKSRLAHRIQLTTDGLKIYVEAIESAFGCEIDYGMLVKLYGAAPEGAQVRYSPAICLASRKSRITGNPDFDHISTSFMERRTSRCECRCGASPGLPTLFQRRLRITSTPSRSISCITILPAFTRHCGSLRLWKPGFAITSGRLRKSLNC